MDGDQPVGQRQVALRARAVVLLEQALAAGGDCLPNAVAGEQGLVERGHELRRGDRVDAVGHRDYRRAAGLEQRGGDRGFQFLADRAGLAGIQHHDRDLALGQYLRDLRRPDVGHCRCRASRTPGLPRPSRSSSPGRPAIEPPPSGAAGHRAVAVEVDHVERLARVGGLPYRVAQRVERGRAQHGQADLAADRVEPFEQRAGHHLVAHVRVPAGREITISTRSFPPGTSRVPGAVGDREAAGDAARA